MKFINESDIRRFMCERDCVVLDIEHSFFDLIVSGKKQHEIRKRDLRDKNKIVFIDNKSMTILGMVQIKNFAYYNIEGMDETDFYYLIKDLIRDGQDIANREFMENYLKDAEEICISKILEVYINSLFRVQECGEVE